MRDKEQEQERTVTASTDEGYTPTPVTPEDLEYAAALIEGHAVRNEHKWSDLTKLVIERRYLRFRSEAERLRQLLMSSSAAVSPADGSSL
jgi:hypothetical protein